MLLGGATIRLGLLQLAGLLAAVLVAYDRPSYAASVTVECSGSKDASTLLVYMHGLDTPQPSRQEVENRTMIKQLASDLGIRLAIARSSFLCKGKLCWPHQTTEDHQRTFALLSEAVKSCSSNKTAAWGVLGFSNGGYFASKITQYCYKDGPSWVIAVGSAGKLSNDFVTDKKKCPNLALLIGEKDLTIKKARLYAEQLKKAGFPAEYSTFKGGHELDVEALQPLIATFLKK